MPAKYINLGPAGEYVCVGRAEDVIMSSEKALCLPFGRTLDGDLITTWYPRSLIVLKNGLQGTQLFVPVWARRNKMCNVGDPEARLPSGFSRLETDLPY